MSISASPGTVLSQPAPCDVVFPVAGRSVCSDHTYLLFAAFSGIEPRLRERAIGIDRLAGTLPLAGGYVGITAQTRLRLRVDPADISLVLPLAGKPIRVRDVTIRLGAPRIYPLRPAPDLYSRIVTIKGFVDPASFAAAAVRQLQRLGIAAEPLIGHRSILAVRGNRIVGFSMLLCGLTPPDSFLLQRIGIGGRRRLGGGIFTPAPTGLRAQFEKADERDEPRVVAT